MSEQSGHTQERHRSSGSGGSSASGRRDFIKHAGVAAAAAAGGVATTEGAWAATTRGDAAATLPPIGETIPGGCLALNASLTVRAEQLDLDFVGGLRVTVCANPDDPTGESVRLKVIDFVMGANHPDLGTITVEGSDAATTPASLLEQVSTVPPQYKNTMFLNFTLTIEQPPSPAGVTNALRPESLTLSTKSAAEFVATLDQFPPDGASYKLQNPVDLVVPGHPDQPVGSIADSVVTASAL